MLSEYKDLSDEKWLEAVILSQYDNTLKLPGFPDNKTQETFVGFSGEAALREAYLFYKIVRNCITGSSSEAEVLDFGVGWGRVIRFFLRDCDSSKLHGVDVDSEILEICRKTNVPGDLKLIGATDKLPFEDNYFGLVYSYSVFSHLSEAGAKNWLEELIRVSKRGHKIVITTTGMSFIDLCCGCFSKLNDRNSYEEIYANLFVNPYTEKQRYTEGNFVYAPAGGASSDLSPENYGWASIPHQWIERNFGEVVAIEDFKDDTGLPQNVLILLVK